MCWCMSVDLVGQYEVFISVWYTSAVEVSVSQVGPFQVEDFSIPRPLGPGEYEVLSLVGEGDQSVNILI